LNGILVRERIRHCAAVGFLALLGCVLLVVMTTPVKLPPQLREDNYFENLVDDTHAVALFARDHFSRMKKFSSIANGCGGSEAPTCSILIGTSPVRSMIRSCSCALSKRVR